MKKLTRGPASTRHPLRQRSEASLRRGGYTLIELIVAVGLFAVIMTLASGAYLFMIGLDRQVQGVATGIDNLAFALEDMTRSIRIGTTYSGTTGNSFSFTDVNGQPITYSFADSAIQETKNSKTSMLTDPSVTITSLMFYPTGVARSDTTQARVTMVVSGTVSSGPGKTTLFTVETGATMRGSDL